MSGEQPPRQEAPGVPAGRYGPSEKDRRGLLRRRTITITFAAVLVAILAVVGVLAYQNLGSKPIGAERSTFTQLPGNALELTIQVHRDQPQRAGVCIVRTRDIDGVESGRREVLIPPGQSTLSAVIKGATPPVTASVVGCSYNVPSYMSQAVPPTG